MFTCLWSFRTCNVNSRKILKDVSHNLFQYNIFGLDKFVQKVSKFRREFLYPPEFFALLAGNVSSNRPHQGSATYGPRAGSGKIIRTAGPLQIVVTVWPA